MFIPTTMLAQDSDGIGTIVYGLIFLLIWIISAITSAVGKWQQEKRKRERIAEMMRRQEGQEEHSRTQERRSAAEPSPYSQRRSTPRPTSRTAQSPVPVPPPLPQTPRSASVRRQQPTPRRQPQVVAERRASPVPRVPPSRPSQRVAPQTPIVQQTTIGQMDARSLRRHIIMMEILQPPVALRPEHPALGW